MIKQLHSLLTSNGVTRRVQRRVVRSLKSTMSCPDAYSDLAVLIQRTAPDAVLDIGSHVGLTIDRLLEDNQVPVHGFEPTPATFDKLAKRFHSHPLVTVHNIALSDKTEKATFYCNANEQTNSLLDNDEGNLEELANHTRHVETRTIQTIRMDEWIAANLSSKKVVVKSDVQGAEGLLLAGGMNTFRDQVIAFYSEAQISPMYKGQLDLCSMHQLLVQELGFVLHNIYPCFHDRQGRALQTDALWIKEAYLNS